MRLTHGSWKDCSAGDVSTRACSVGCDLHRSSKSTREAPGNPLGVIHLELLGLRSRTAAEESREMKRVCLFGALVVLFCMISTWLLYVNGDRLLELFGF